MKTETEGAQASWQYYLDECDHSEHFRPTTAFLNLPTSPGHIAGD